MKNSQYTTTNYFHRDLSWLLFNRRVIEEAGALDHPLLERFRFLAIGSTNADEFFMIRVPGLQSLARMSGEKKDSRTGWTQSEVLDKVFEMETENIQRKYSYLHTLEKELSEGGYEKVTYQELSDTHRQEMNIYFEKMILPALTPIGLDAYHAFPKIVEKKLHLFVKVRQGDREESAIIPVPPLFNRYIQLDGMKKVLLIEDLIQNQLEKVFVGWKIVHSFNFRITYDKDLEFAEDTEENLFIQMEEYVQERLKGLPSRLEVSISNKEENQTDIFFLSQMLDLKEKHIYYVPYQLDLSYLFGYIDAIAAEHSEWVYRPVKENVNPTLVGESLYREIDKDDLLLHHPYDSYESVVSFLEEAANDTNTIAIKMTLYRVAKHSRVVQALKNAAKEGKQVTVLVELKARFDEENNLHWVQELEKAGCYVTYGLQHLKTHSKATLIVKKVDNQIKQYVHLGTGNYNETTARLYTDLSLFSSREPYVEDVSSFFNYLSGYRSLPEYKKLAVSPEGIRSMLLQKIKETTDYYVTTGEGSIDFKMNSLTDQVIIDALYEASQKGVPITVVVRGSCCLRPGVPGLSETIVVKSIVGRFLEHSRIYGFETNQSTFWLSSADAMTRNMMLRVEIAAPIETPSTLGKVSEIWEEFTRDERKAYFLDKDGEYYRKKQANDFSAQSYQLNEAQNERMAMKKVEIAGNQTNKNPLIQKIKQILKKSSF